MIQKERLIGWLSLLGSALCFYLATVIISWGKPYVRADSSFYVLARFLFGLVLVSATLIAERRLPRCHNVHAIVGRALTNAVAVLCFYKAVEVSTVASANILNMTYPIFVAILSWFTLRKQRDILAIGIVAISTLGIWLILKPDPATAGGNDIWGLLSGIFAAFSMIYLTMCRRQHDSTTILFYVFILGSLLMLPLMAKSLFIPNLTEIFFLTTCSLAGVLGQYLLTYGFLFVTAVEGSVFSSSRILIAALLGPVLVADPPLSWTGWLGALLIFGANVALALRKPQLPTTHPHH